MTLKLHVQKRTLAGKKVKTLRKHGKIPAVLYGHKIENINLEISRGDFLRIFKMAGESTLIDLAVAGEKDPVKVIIQDVQPDPLRGDFLHVDFHQVNMKEKLHTHIKLKFIGEAPAVKGFGGVLVTNKNSLEVKCLPGDLVSEIEVDLSALKSLEDSIRVGSLHIPKGIEVFDQPEDMVVIVTESKTEKEAEAMKAAPTEAKVEPEVIGKKEKEGEGAATDAESKKEEMKKTESEK